MATISSQPPVVFLSGNEAKFKVTETAETGEISTTANNRLSFINPNIFAYGEDQPAFYLRWGEKSEPFYLSHNPGNDGCHINFLEDFANNMAQYIAAVFAKLQLNVALRTDFAIVNSGTYITLKAFRYGANYNLTFVAGANNYNIGSIVNFVPGINQTIFNRKTLNSFIITPDTTSESERNFTTNPLNYATQIAELDIAGYTKKNAFSHFSYPENASIIVKQPSAIQEVNVSLMRCIDGISTPIAFSGPFYAIQGKLSDMRMAMLKSEGKNFLQFIDTGSKRKFLTFAPNPKNTDIYCPEKLYYLVPSTGDYRLTVKKYFSSFDKTTNYEPTALQGNSIIEIQASYKKISEAEIFPIYSYEIWLSDALGNKCSETFGFTVDRRYQSYARYFLFKNSFGMFDCFRTTGKVTKEKDIEKTLIELDSAARSATQKSHLQTSVDTSIKYKIETGLTDVAHNEWKQELAESEHVLFLKNKQAYPVVIPEVTLKSDESEYIESDSITLTHLAFDDFTAEFTSESPIFPDFSDDYNKDYNSYSTQNAGDPDAIANAGADITSNVDHVVLNAIPAIDGAVGKWSKVSGPGTAIFAYNEYPNSLVTFSENGVYVLRWTVTYNENTSYDDMVCTIAVPDVVMPSYNLKNSNKTSIELSFNYYKLNPFRFIVAYNTSTPVLDNQALIFLAGELRIHCPADLQFGLSTKASFSPGTYEIIIVGNIKSSNVLKLAGQDLSFTQENSTYTANITITASGALLMYATEYAADLILQTITINKID